MVVYKVIVADDEPLMLEGWKTIIDWKKFGYELCGAASDGDEALELVERIEPDLLLTDIRMPGLSGLDLIRVLQERRGLHTKSVIVSGYAEFDYARQALRFGVDRYVLKPIVSEEIHELLQELRAPLDSVVETRRSSAELRSAAVQSCISGLLRGEPTAVKEAEMLLGPDNRPLCMLLAEPGLEKRQENGRSARAVLEGVAEHLQAKGVNAWAFEDAQGRAGLLAACSTPSLLRASLRSEGHMSDLYRYSGVGVQGYEAVPLLHAQATAEREKPYFFRNAEKESTYTDMLTAAQQILTHIESGQPSAAEQSISELFKLFAQREVPSGWINSLIRHVLDRLSLIRPPIPEISSVFAQSRISAEKELKLRCRIEAERIAESLAASAEISEHPLRAAIAHVNEHYGDKLQLRELAERLGMNPVYLGQAFKRETGYCFNDYIHRLRAEEAQRLLRRTDMKISEIAERLGYHDTEYFSTKFKAATDELPSAYRIREQVTVS